MPLHQVCAVCQGQTQLLLCAFSEVLTSLHPRVSAAQVACLQQRLLSFYVSSTLLAILMVRHLACSVCVLDQVHRKLTVCLHGFALMSVGCCCCPLHYQCTFHVNMQHLSRTEQSRVQKATYQDFKQQELPQGCESMFQMLSGDKTDLVPIYRTYIGTHVWRQDKSVPCFCIAFSAVTIFSCRHSNIVALQHAVRLIFGNSHL